jgi:hypothetical protein
MAVIPARVSVLHSEENANFRVMPRVERESTGETVIPPVRISDQNSPITLALATENAFTHEPLTFYYRPAMSGSHVKIFFPQDRKHMFLGYAYIRVQ